MNNEESKGNDLSSNIIKGQSRVERFNRKNNAVNDGVFKEKGFETRENVKFYKKWPEFPQRLRIIPGITGYAQVNGGYDISPEEKCHLDNYYIEHYSFAFDMKLRFKL